MSTHNIGFNEEMTKIIFHLSSNMHLICFSGVLVRSTSPRHFLFLKTYDLWRNKQTYEPRREKTGFLHMRKQRRRSASR